MSPIVLSSQQLDETRPKFWLVLLFVLGSCYGVNAEAMLYAPLLLLAAALVPQVSRLGALSIKAASSRAFIAGVAICMLSLLGAARYGDVDSAAFTGALLFVLAAFYLLQNALGLERVLASYAWAGLIVIVGFWAMDFEELLLRARNLEWIASDIGRYGGPFGAHPNLVGHMIGCFVAVLALSAWFKTGVLRKAVFLAAALAGLGLLLASGSRGGLFAMLIAVFGTVVWCSPSRKTTIVVGAALAVALVLIGVAAIPNAAVDTLVAALELRSEYRGVESGLSGRTTIWAAVLDYLATENFAFLIGSGLRSTHLNEMFESIDNGYLVVLAEVGLLGLVLWLVRLAYILKASATSARRGSLGSVLIFAVVLFSVGEAMVARYFMALGNSASLLLLLLFVTYSRPRTHAVEASPRDRIGLPAF